MALQRFKATRSISFKVLPLWVGIFGVIGVTTLLLTKAATPGIAVTVDSSLPNPTNVKTFADDRVATISWDPVANPDSKNIIGYYVTWGTGSTTVGAKQTEANVAQIQPLVNGTTYNVKVQAVQGSQVTVPVTNGHYPTATERRANGKVSTGTSSTVTASSARVDQLKTQMTGFYDDFNTAAGAFDELKWNNAPAICGALGAAGDFVNNQFHAHTQLTSSSEPNCDRGQTVNRARAIFDTTGKTEANPGALTFDFDGVTMGRDIWYIDLIPSNAKKDGSPIDLTSHHSVFDDDVSDPSSLRLVQNWGEIYFLYYDANKQPTRINATTLLCGGRLDNCDTAGKQQAGLSALPEMPFNNARMNLANVRQHWRMEVSPTKIKLFVNSVKMYEAPMPALFSNTNKWYVHNNLFTYNTGKETPADPTTSILHWDNFGFNGPAPTTVVHNYLDGGPDGKTVYLGRGTSAAEIPESPRNLKINIPDPIGSPLKAKLMFTLGINGPDHFYWNSGQNITINGKKYNFENPLTGSTGEQAPHTNPDITDGYSPFTAVINISPADLKQGINDIGINIESRFFTAINTHVELEYTKGTEPAYTQPTAVFGASKMLAAIQPTMTSHDSYLFVEQDFGLPSGNLDGTTPVDPPPTTGDTTKPTVSLTGPATNTSVTVGSSFTASASASDNVAVTKVEFYLGNTKLGTVTTPPYDLSVSTTGLNASNYDLVAVAYDGAGNLQPSSSRTIIVTDAQPTIKRCNFNSDNIVNITDLSILLSKFGTAVSPGSIGDCRVDGKIDILDLSLLLAQFNT